MSERLHYTPAGWVREGKNALRGSTFDEEKDAELIKDVCERLSTENASEVTVENLLTAIVYSLAWDYGAFIDGMHCDQWAAVSARTGDGEVTVWAECYNLLAGAALAWKLIADNVEPQER